MVDSAHFVKSAPLRVFTAIFSTFCGCVTDVLKICMKKFDAEKIFFWQTDRVFNIANLDNCCKIISRLILHSVWNQLLELPLDHFNTLQVFISVNLFAFQIAGGYQVSHIYCQVSLGWRKSCICFWGRLDQNFGFHGNVKPPLTYSGENDVSTFSRLFLIRSFLYLQVTRTCIKSRTSSNFGQIEPLTTELAALEV